MSTALLLTYALPLRQIGITGKDQDPGVWLNAQEAAANAFAGEYPDSASANYSANRTTPELVADLSSWSPTIRWIAADEIRKRPSEHQSLRPTLETMATSDPDFRKRMGACFALGMIADPASVPVLAGLLTDPNNLVRWGAAKGLGQVPPNVRSSANNTILAAIAARMKWPATHQTKSSPTSRP